ncbi:MAG: nickel pincer cofactor biosynthesis protein LarB [Deltaproteobacteria bacterium]|nr:nickel pincer cofactor biosynthesis protein LarB [Deltaproteobacteria bacterium]
MSTRRRTLPFLALLALGWLPLHAVTGPAASARTKSAAPSRAPMGNEQVVFCGNKSPERVQRDFAARIANNAVVIGTKATRAQYEALQGSAGLAGLDLQFHELAGVITLQAKKVRSVGRIVVATAGTADIPVAEEAARVAEAMGNKVLRVYDCGVNKPEKVRQNKRAFNACNVVIAVAGMEGGLPNAIAATTNRPVIAVPTSVGYGTGLGGLAALMGMLNACSPGITVVNIDNGFGAAYVADRINKQSAGRGRGAARR